MGLMPYDNLDPYDDGRDDMLTDESDADDLCKCGEPADSDGCCRDCREPDMFGDDGGEDEYDQRGRWNYRYPENTVPRSVKR